MSDSQEPEAEQPPIDQEVILLGYRLHDYEHLVALLAESRKEHRLSHAKLAELLGCASTLIGLRERGERGMKGPAIFELADALGYGLALIPHRPTGSWLGDLGA